MHERRTCASYTLVWYVKPFDVTNVFSAIGTESPFTVAWHCKIDKLGAEAL